MNKTKIVNAVTKTAHKAVFHLKRKSPTILVVSGIIGGVGAAVWACKQTKKAEPITEDMKAELASIKENLEDDALPDYDKTEYRKEYVKICVVSAGRYLKIYAGPIALGAASITGILAGHNILNKRYIEKSLAFGALMDTFAGYQSRVAARFGEDVEKEIRYNLTPTEITSVETGEDGKKKKVKDKIQVTDQDTRLSEYSMYAFKFDSDHIDWNPHNMDSNYHFLKLRQNAANIDLQHRGYLFLHEVLEHLGFPRTIASNHVGWIYDPKYGIEDVVDFRITPVYEPDGSMSYIVDPNVRDIEAEFEQHQRLFKE